MRSRWAQPREQQALQELWKLCFGDGEEVTDCFFALFPPKLHTRVIEEKGKIAAMASWLPTTLHMDGGTFPGAYIYAVATHPDFRSRGLCRCLMEELENSMLLQDQNYMALCPAEASLYRFYGAMGYETAFYHHIAILKPEREPGALRQISPSAYLTLRESLLSSSHCEWTREALDYLSATGCRFYRLEAGGCAAVQQGSGGSIRVVELLSEDESQAVSSVCHVFGGQEAEASRPGEGQPHGMLKWLKNKQIIEPFYLGFAFD